MIRWGIIGCGDVCEKKSGPAFALTRGSSVSSVMRRDRAKARSYATFMANRGLKLMLENARDEAIVVPCTLLYEDGRFRLRCSPAVTRDEAMQSYYDSAIGESVISAPRQWLLWYWADKLMS